MYAFEVCYREDGLYKARGFKYRDQFERFLSRMQRKSNVVILKYADNTKGFEVVY